MKRVINVHSLDQTNQLAMKIGTNLRGGETIELSSDVGGGKTTFVKALVKGTGSKEHVTSPTFTICNKYSADKFDICHFDFYRLPEPGLIEHELDENVADKSDVVIVEWSDIVKHVLPDDRLKIAIKSTGEESRELDIDLSDKFAYLLNDI